MHAPSVRTVAVLPLTYRLVYRPTWHDVEFDRGKRRVRVPAGLVLDLGATAKAWCADRCAARIHRELGVGVLVSLGGDIATAGVGPDGGWLVRVQDLPDATNGPNAVVVLRDGCAVATSSTISRTWQRGTSRLHHILDPATRRPAAPDLANGDRRRQQLRRRQRGDHRGDCAWPRCRTVARRTQDGRPPCRPERPRAHARRVAGGGCSMSSASIDKALWYLGRSSGVVSLVLLTLVVALGIATRSGRLLPGLPRFAVSAVHRSVEPARSRLPDGARGDTHARPAVAAALAGCGAAVREPTKAALDRTRCCFTGSDRRARCHEPAASAHRTSCVARDSLGGVRVVAIRRSAHRRHRHAISHRAWMLGLLAICTLAGRRA